MNKKVIVVSLILLFFTVVGFFADKNETAVVKENAVVNKEQGLSLKASEVIRVSDFEQTLGQQPAVSIAFGESENNWCDLTVQRQSIKEGYKIISERSDRYNEISISCNSGESLYVGSANHQTNVVFEILSVDTKSKKAEVMISAKLINSGRLNKNQTDEFADIDKVRLVISENNFDNLTKR